MVCSREGGVYASACKVLKVLAAEWLRGGKRKGWVRKTKIGKKKEKKKDDDRKAVSRRD